MEKTMIRVTKAQKLSVLKEIIPADFRYVFPGNENKIEYVFDQSEAIKFIDAELGLLAKKNSGDKKLTKDQQANEQYKNEIVTYLTNLPDDKEGATCTEMFKAIPSLSDYSPQKVSALCRILKQEVRIDSKEVKGKTLFFAL